MGFSVNLRSVDGYFTGYCKPCTSLADAQWQNEPPESTTTLVPITFQVPFEGGESYWNEKYKPCCNNYINLQDASTFILFLRGQGYTNVNNPCLVCAFDAVNDGQTIGKQVVVMAYADATNFFRYQVGVRTRTQSGWNYVGMTSWYDAQITNYGFGLVAGTFYRNNKTYYCFGFFTANQIRQGYVVGGGSLGGGSSSTIIAVLGGEIPGQETSPEFGPASTAGGGYNEGDGGHGTFDDSSDIIGIDAKPNVGVTTMGFVNVYKITQGQLQQLGEKLFPHFLPAEILADPAQLTTPEVLTMMIKTLYGALISPVGTTVQLADNLGIIDILMNGKLIDYVIDCHAIPTSISDSTVEGLKVGYRQFNDLQVARANEDYVDVDCGELSIGEYFANFLDFSNISCDLFLPFVGYVPIDSEYWNGGTLKVVYRFNIVDGSFQAKVLATSGKSQLKETIIGQYGGVACVHYPITGLQYSNVVAGLVNGSISAVASGASGDYGKTATSLANMAMLRPDNPMSNGYNASSSFLTHRTPYLVIKRPTAQFSTQYPKEKGLPLNVSMKLSNVHGFTVVDNPVLNISCSDSEYQELVSFLKNGVILP